MLIVVAGRHLHRRHGPGRRDRDVGVVEHRRVRPRSCSAGSTRSSPTGPQAWGGGRDRRRAQLRAGLLARARRARAAAPRRPRHRREELRADPPAQPDRQGIVPLTFADEADLDGVAVGDDVADRGRARGGRDGRRGGDGDRSRPVDRPPADALAGRARDAARGRAARAAAVPRGRCSALDSPRGCRSARHDGRRELPAAGLADRPRAPGRAAARRACGRVELWRVPEPYLEEAQDDATRLAVADMERAGVDIVTDGEMRRESYSNRFATALDGVDLDTPGVALDRTGHENPVPRVVGPIRRTRPGRGARRRVPALAHDAADQDHRPGPVHDDAAGAERPLRRRAQPRARVRRGRERRAARPEGGGRRRRPDRRAVPAGAARAGARVRARGDRPRARRDRGRHRAPHVLRLRAHRPRPAPRLPVPRRARRLRGDARLARGGAAEPRPGGAGEPCRARRSCSACSTSARREVETPERRGGADPPRARGRPAPSGSSSRPTAG